MGKVMDEKLGIDYSYMLNRKDIPLRVITEDDVMAEDTDLMRAFMEANAEITPYIDKALFDPTAVVARHILDLCKDKSYMVKVGEKEYRLPQVIMMVAMQGCYQYVTDVAKALAEQTNNKQSIQLSDADVFAIAENYFRHGGDKAEIKTDDKKKKAEPKKAAAKNEQKKTDTEDDSLPFEIDAEEDTSYKQLSFFD